MNAHFPVIVGFTTFTIRTLRTGTTRRRVGRGIGPLRLMPPLSQIVLICVATASISR